MKRHLAFLMALVLLLAGCGDSGNVSDGNVPVASPPFSSANTSPDQNQLSSSPEQQPKATYAVTPLQITTSKDSCGEWDDNYNALCYASWEEIQLMDDYPRLQAALDNLNIEQSVGAYSFVHEWLSYAEEMMAENADYFNGFTLNSEYAVQRADSLILSIREDFDSYTGGVHPNYGAMGWNFDTATGKQLALEDVLTNTDTLDELLTKKIREKYPDYHFDSLDLMLMEYMPENYTWTLGYQGITFYFSPYEIASFAAGLLTATIWFDEMPELFREEYTATPEGGWSMELPYWSDIEAVITNTDRRDTLSYVTTEGDLGKKVLTLIFNGRDYTDKSWLSDTIALSLVCEGAPGSEQFYLQADCTEEDGSHTQRMYALDTGTPQLIADVPNSGNHG